MSAPEEHDGTRRWAVYYHGKTGGRCTFYSDALTMAGALEHFKRSTPDTCSTHVRRVRSDEWLNR